ncbi:putative repeat protein (TIGR01451 family)/fimbrial isopeptide formation D2 family protein, partial [Pseudogracilibacillus auburnensis]
MSRRKIVTGRMKARVQKSMVFLAMFLILLNGILPSASSFSVEASEKSEIEEINDPEVSKTIDGEKTKEMHKGEDYKYDVNVLLPKDLSGYSTISILDKLDSRLKVIDTMILIDGEEEVESKEKSDEVLKAKVEGQIVTFEIDLTDEKLEELAGKELTLQITAQVKEDAGTGEEIENIAEIMINDNPAIETNPAVVTPIDLEEKDQAEPNEAKEKEQAKPDELKEEKEQAEPDELKEEKDQAEPTASKEDGEKNVESNENPSAEKSAKASANDVAAAAAALTANLVDTYATITVNNVPYIYHFSGTKPYSYIDRVQITGLPNWTNMNSLNALAVSKSGVIYFSVNGVTGGSALPRVYRIDSAGKATWVGNLKGATVNATMVDDRYYYVVGGNTLHYVDVTTGATGVVNLVNPSGVPLDGLGADMVADADGYIWTSQADSIIQINPRTSEILRRLPVSGLSAFPSGVRGMAFTSEGKILISTNGYNTPNTFYTIDEDGKLTLEGDKGAVPITSGGIGDLGSALTPVFEPFPPILESDKEVKIVQKGLGNRVNQISDQIQTGDTLAYTIRARNTKAAPSILKGLSITDTLPAGVEYVPGTLMIDNQSMSDSSGDDNGEFVNGTVTGNIGDVLDTNYHTLTFQVKVLPGYEENKILNTADVESLNTDPQNPTAEFVVEPGNADMTLEKMVDHDKAYVGDILTYTVKASNSSTGGAWNGTIADNLPEGLELVSGTTQLNETVLADEDVWTDSQLSVQDVALKAGETATVIFQVKVLDSVLNETIINVATADDPSDSDDPIDSNEVKTSILYKDPVLQSEKSSKIEMKASGNTDADNPEVGDTIRYTITTKNTIEDSLVENLVITDMIPAGLTYVPDSLEVDGKSVTDAKDEDAGHVVDSEVTGTFGDVTDTNDHTVTFLVTVDKGQSGKTIKNIAVVGGDNGDPNEPEEEVDIYPREPKLESKKSSKLEKKAEGNTDADNPEVGDTIRYTITTKNTIEDSLVENLVITDMIPAGLTYVPGSLEVDGKSVTDSKDTDAGHVVDSEVTGTFGDVTDTNDHTVTFLVTVDKGQSGKTIKNIAVVGGDNGDPNEPEEEVDIYPREPKLESKKSSKLEKKAEGNTDADNPEVGDTIRY